MNPKIEERSRILVTDQWLFDDKPSWPLDNTTRNKVVCNV